MHNLIDYMMKYIRTIGSVLLTLMFIGLGTAGLYFLLEDLRARDAGRIEAQFNLIRSDIQQRIVSNFTALGNYLFLDSLGVDSIYRDVNLKQLETIGSGPTLVSGFSILRILHAKIIYNSTEKDEIIEIGKKIYNISQFQPFNLVNGSGQPIPPTEYPRIQLLFTFPHGATPSLPALGSINLASVTTPQEVSDILSMNNEFSVSKIRRILRVDGTLNTVISVDFVGNGWFITALFSPTEFLNNLVPDVSTNDIQVKVSDLEGIFYNNSQEQLELSSIRTSESIPFKFRNWTIEFVATKKFVDDRKSDFQTTILSIGIPLVVLICLSIWLLYAGFKILMRNRLVIKELEGKKNVEIVKSSIQLVLHEVRTIINYAYMIFDIKEINQVTNNDLITIKGTIEDVNSMTTNILDFEKIMSGKYIPSDENTNLVEEIDSIIKKCTIFNITFTYTDIGIVNIDKGKFMNIFTNGFNNAIKHSKHSFILIRLQKQNDNIIVEIINQEETFPISDIENLFIPYFIYEAKDQKIWDDTKNNLLKLDKVKYDEIKKYLSIEEFKNNKFYHKSSEAQSIQNSSGIGLAISRMIAKTLGGECGMTYEDHLVRFWFTIKNNPISQNLEI